VNVSPGVGVYRSDDGGATWVHAGLRDAGQIGRIRIHPRNPDLVYAAVLGHASAPNATRGVFRSSDGGRSWQKVLFISEGTGIVDLALDPADPRVLYAASWSFERKPWAFENGGTEGGIFKSEDSGDTWTSFRRPAVGRAGPHRRHHLSGATVACLGADRSGGRRRRALSI